MATKRSYADGCASAHGLDLIGERWALLVVRELILGPKRFTDLRAGLPGISPNVLTERLDELERVAIVQRRKLPLPAGSWVYELTDWGRELEQVIMALGRWAARSPVLPLDNPMSIDSIILSLRTMFDPHAAAGFKADIAFLLGGEPNHARIAGGQMALDRGTVADPDVAIASDPDTLAAVVYGGLKIADAVRSGKMTVEGDKSVLKRFVTLFPLPERAAAPAARTTAGNNRS